MYRYPLSREAEEWKNLNLYLDFGLRLCYDFDKILTVSFLAA